MRKSSVPEHPYQENPPKSGRGHRDVWKFSQGRVGAGTWSSDICTHCLAWTLSFCPQQVSTPGSQTRTAELCIFAFQPGHSHPLSFAHLELQRFLKPTEVPPVSFTYTWVISSDLSSQALVVLYGTSVFWTDVSIPLTVYSCAKINSCWRCLYLAVNHN